MPDTIIESAPIEWEVITLGDLCSRGGGDIQTGPFGSQLHASDYVQTGVPSVMPQNIGDNVIIEDGIARITQADAKRLERYLLAPGDIVYSRRGDVERRALVRAEHSGWLCGTGCLRVRSGDAVDPRFLSYYLGHPDPRAWIIRHAIGATMPNLNTQILGALPVTLPPRGVQESVSTLLGALDDKIAVNKRICRTAVELLQAHHVQASKYAYRSIRLGDVIDLCYGKALKEVDRTPGSIPVYGGNGVSGWHDRPLVSGPGIIVGRKGANAGSVSWSQKDFWAIDTAFYIRPTAAGVTLEFLYFLLQSVGLTGQVGDSAIPGLNRSIALACETHLPDDAEIARFTNLARPILQAIDQREREDRVLAELRSTLLPKLMSGELRIRDAERVVENAA